MRVSATNQGSLATGGASEGSGNVVWFTPGRHEYVPPPMPETEARSERRSARIVMVLTLSCTAMAILDLFLLASGS